MTTPDTMPGTSAPAPVLTGAEADRRVALLADLERALTARGVSCVLARTRRIVLKEGPVPLAPSGPTDPQLWIFAPACHDIATTDGRAYYLASDRQCPAGDPASAAIALAPLATPTQQHAASGEPGDAAGPARDGDLVDEHAR